jgi:hypothetical protein
MNATLTNKMLDSVCLSLWDQILAVTPTPDGPQAVACPLDEQSPPVPAKALDEPQTPVFEFPAPPDASARMWVPVNTSCSYEEFRDEVRLTVEAEMGK